MDTKKDTAINGEQLNIFGHKFQHVMRPMHLAMSVFWIPLVAQY